MVDGVMDPSVTEVAMQVNTMAAALCETIKRSQDTVSLTDARMAYANIREAEGWLLSCRTFLSTAEQRR